MTPRGKHFADAIDLVWEFYSDEAPEPGPTEDEWMERNLTEDD